MMVLAVSRSAQRGTSGMIEGLAACFTGLEDPRETRRCDHQLVDILAIAVCAVIACAESWEDIELYGRSKRAWLKPGFPIWIRPTHPKAAEMLAKRGITSFTHRVRQDSATCSSVRY